MARNFRNKQRLIALALAVVIFSGFLFSGGVSAAEPVIGWQEEFNSPEAPADGTIFYEDRGSGKNGEAVVIKEIKDGVLRYGLKYDPARKQDRFALYFGDVWHKYSEWGPFDMREFPYVEIKWRGNSFELYYGVETASGGHANGYTWPKTVRIEKDSQGQDWNIGLLRLAPDISVPTSGTFVKLTGLSCCLYSPPKEEQVTEIDYIRVRGFTGAEAAAEKPIVESFTNFPKARWRGFDSFFPFGIYGVGYLRGDFESWGGDYEGAYATYGRNRLNFVAADDAVELGRFGAQKDESSRKGYIAEMKRLILAAEASGLKISADVRRMMEGRSPADGYQQLLPICQDLATAFPDDKTVVAWAMADEVGADALINYGMMIRAVRESDPLQRPELMVFNSITSFTPYKDYLQLGYWDSYPGHNPWSIRDIAKEYRKAMPGKPVWAVLPSFESIPPNKGYDRISGAEMRLMAYLALAEGAKGLIWYNGWEGTGSLAGVVTRTGNPYTHYLPVLKELAQQIIPIGQQLLFTDTAEDIAVEVKPEEEVLSGHTVTVSALKHRQKPVYYLVAINEDLSRVLRARVNLPAKIVLGGYGVFDLFKLDGRNLLAEGNSFQMEPLAGGDGRIYLVADEKEFSRQKNALLCAAARENIRVLLPDLTLARRWGLPVGKVEAAMDACGIAAGKGEAIESGRQADFAASLLYRLMEEDSEFSSTRRMLSEISQELDAMAAVAEFESKNPKWWTGRNHPMLVPNPDFPEISKKYWQVGRAYSVLYKKYLLGEKEDLWGELDKTRTNSLKAREEMTAFLKNKLKPTQEPDVK